MSDREKIYQSVAARFGYDYETIKNGQSSLNHEDFVKIIQCTISATQNIVNSKPGTYDKLIKLFNL